MHITEITGHLILVMAPTGSGKGSLITHVQNTFPQIEQTVSCTTRAKRPNEVDGIDYHFLTRSAFIEKVNAGDFLEWAEFSDNLYGTLKSELVRRLQSGKIVICEIELQGILQLMNMVPDEFRTLVYIDAGDWDVLRARALARAPISETDLNLRYERFLHEKEAKEYADIVVLNHDGNLEAAKAHMTKIIQDIISHLDITQ